MFRNLPRLFFVLLAICSAYSASCPVATAQEPDSDKPAQAQDERDQGPDTPNAGDASVEVNVELGHGPEQSLDPVALEKTVRSEMESQAEGRKEELVGKTGSRKLEIHIKNLVLSKEPDSDGKGVEKLSLSADLKLAAWKTDTNRLVLQTWKIFRFPQAGKPYKDEKELAKAFVLYAISIIEAFQPDPVEFSAQRRPRIAVIEFENASPLESERNYGRALSSMLTTQLKQESQFIILERMSHKSALELWKTGTPDADVWQHLKDLDAVLIGDVSVLDHGRIEVDARLMGLDGRLIASASDKGKSATIRETATRLASKLQADFLRPYTGRVTVVVESPDLAGVEFYPVLSNNHLPEEYPPSAATSAISVSRGLLDSPGLGKDCQDLTRSCKPTRATEGVRWRTHSGLLELDLLKGWYVVRVSHPGYRPQGTDGRGLRVASESEQSAEDSTPTIFDGGSSTKDGELEYDDVDRANYVMASRESEAPVRGSFYDCQGLGEEQDCLVYVGEREGFGRTEEGEAEGAPSYERAPPNIIRFRSLEPILGQFQVEAPQELSRCLKIKVRSLTLDSEKYARERAEFLGCPGMSQTGPQDKETDVTREANSPASDEVVEGLSVADRQLPKDSEDFLHELFFQDGRRLRSAQKTSDLLRKTQCQQIHAGATSYSYNIRLPQTSSASSSLDRFPPSGLPSGSYELTITHPDFVETTIVGRITEEPTTRIVLADVIGQQDDTAISAPTEVGESVPLRQQVNLRRQLHGPFLLPISHRTGAPAILKYGPGESYSLRIKTSNQPTGGYFQTDPQDAVFRDNMIVALADKEKIVLRLASDDYRLSTEMPEFSEWSKRLQLASSCLGVEATGQGEQEGETTWRDEAYDDLAVTIRELRDIKPPSDIDDTLVLDSALNISAELEEDGPHCERIKTGFWTAGLKLEGNNDSDKNHLPDRCFPRLFPSTGKEDEASDYKTLRRRLKDVDLLILDPSTVSHIQGNSNLSWILEEFLAKGHAALVYTDELRPHPLGWLDVRSDARRRGRTKIDFRPGELWNETGFRANSIKIPLDALDRGERYKRPTLQLEDESQWRVLAKSKNCWFCRKHPRIVETHWGDGEVPGYLMLWADDPKILAEKISEEPAKSEFAHVRRLIERRAVCTAKELMFHRLSDKSNVEWNPVLCEITPKRESL